MGFALPRSSARGVSMAFAVVFALFVVCMVGVVVFAVTNAVGRDRAERRRRNDAWGDGGQR